MACLFLTLWKPGLGLVGLFDYVCIPLLLWRIAQEPYILPFFTASEQVTLYIIFYPNFLRICNADCLCLLALTHNKLLHMKRHLLLIDDDDDEFDLLKLLTSGIPELDCLYADNGFDGIKIIENLSPDVVLLDMNMPIMNGLECLKKIRLRKELKDIPVYIYSNSSAVSMKNEVLLAGATGCLTKPSNIQNLTQIILNVLDETTDYAIRIRQEKNN